MNAFALKHPVGFVLILSVATLIVLMLVTGLAYSQLQKSHANIAMTAARVVLAGLLLALLARLGGLQPAGITRWGSWQVWLVALGSMVLFTGASLYAFYNKVAFNFSALAQSPEAHTLAWTNLAVVLFEEFLYRGVILFVLTRAWGSTAPGRAGSVVLAAALFAVPHLTSLLMGVSLRSILWLVAETFVIAVWWGALVLWGGSIWPAVVLHLIGNTLVAAQGLITPVITPEYLVYQRALWFGLPLGVLGIVLLLLQSRPTPP